MLGMISIPTMTVPVVSTIPIPPVAMKISVVYPMISGRHTENIIRWDGHDRPWHKRYPDRPPRPTVKGSPEPMISMKAIPVAPMEIKTYCVRHHIDIARSTRNYHYVRWSCKYQRRGRWNVNADVHICGPTNNRHAQS
jgi:hypothetical protein